MKRFLFIIFFIEIFILFSCSYNKNSLNEKRQLEIDSIKRTFIPIIKGAWVMSDYIERLEKTKSPLKSMDYSELPGIMSIDIDGNVQGDSIIVGASFNNHEGGNFTIYLIPGIIKKSLKTNYTLDYGYSDSRNLCELGYEINQKDTSLYLYYFNNKNKLVKKKQFTKVYDVPLSNSDAAAGINYIVNKKLISGNYILIDSSNIEKKVQFNNDGKLIGFLNYKKFYINSDFAVGVFNNIDQLSLEIKTNEPIHYGFKINGNMIDLYETKEDTINLTLHLDKLKYKLIKQNK